ncbi:hypothetical protein C1280_27730 [Gemmata obscuriglobus]|uniref:Uncharacterized protein n=1 Tax=Gemmata obscuriglobus TaxID=114 RepID=A0A2Z3H313_9BACT|nr:hypothetical protein C1280_27730 [Gemmata obscuriglobus]
MHGAGVAEAEPGAAPDTARGVVTHRSSGDGGAGELYVRQQETHGVAIRERGEFWYGDTAADIREVLTRTCGKADPLTVFADAVCDCSGRVFSLQIDEEYGEARGSARRAAPTTCPTTVTSTATMRVTLGPTPSAAGALVPSAGQRTTRSRSGLHCTKAARTCAGCISGAGAWPAGSPPATRIGTVWTSHTPNCSRTCATGSRMGSKRSAEPGAAPDTAR